MWSWQSFSIIGLYGIYLNGGGANSGAGSGSPCAANRGGGEFWLDVGSVGISLANDGGGAGSGAYCGVYFRKHKVTSVFKKSLSRSYPI